MRVVSLKNMNVLIKLAEYGSVSIFIFAIYVITQFILASKNNEIVLS